MTLKDKHGKSYFVVVAHLISKCSKNDNKRAAQANVIRTALNQHASSHNHVIIMGVMNDLPGSEPLKQLQKAGVKTISKTSDYSYTYKGKKQLIDHILVSESLRQTASFRTIDLGPVSDHRAVLLTTR